MAPLYLLPQVATGQNRPNIIFILTDDHRYDAVGYVGNDDLRTPNLDSLALRGTVFTNARVTNPISCASRASILTGLYSSHNGVFDFKTPLSENQQRASYPALLKSNGYYTGFIGKYGVGNNNPDEGGIMFDRVECFSGQGKYFASMMLPGKNSNVPAKPDPSEKHLTEVQGDQVLEFLRSRDTDKPFCLSVSFKAPHCQDEMRGIGDEFPIDPVDSTLYDGVRFSPSILCDDKYFDELPESFKMSSPGVMNIGRIRWQYRFSSDSLYQETVRKYYSLIHGVDREIGRITRELRNQGIADDTVIIFMGDNGYFLGEYGLAGKWFHQEESLRVPLFIYDPRDLKGEKDTSKALNVDIAPTILSFAGITSGYGMDGRDLRVKTDRKEVFFEHRYTSNPKKNFIPSMEGIIAGRYKLVHYYTPDTDWFSLYDLSSPYGETLDVSGKEKCRLSILKRKLTQMKTLYK